MIAVKQGFDIFPGGRAALGLVLLRATAALLVVDIGGDLSLSWAGAARALIVMALLAGIGTMAASFCAAALVIWCWTIDRRWIDLPSAALLGDALALALLGAGAWSLDARWFGRRTIRIRASPSARRSQD